MEKYSFNDLWLEMTPIQREKKLLRIMCDLYPEKKVAILIRYFKGKVKKLMKLHIDKISNMYYNLLNNVIMKITK